MSCDGVAISAAVYSRCTQAFGFVAAILLNRDHNPPMKSWCSATERPADMDAQLAFAEAAYAAGERDQAADTLLAMIQHDRVWNDGAARARLLKIFEAVGLEDPWVVATRRKLSRVLFG